ncbi:Gldg family protein [Aurantiacibacter zhengii]|uniref:ABC transporter n=1 Tax=Aurantiacibacter zhengii TaxID=2307003 RepID=A0A418NV02_9SPHN|nr:ABC transporter [Aurantiacibacter zhengii]RIV87851.1 ABC transporter [Aurantiacibacter zhengii]
MLRWSSLLTALALGLAAVPSVQAQEDAPPRLALMGTVPIYWGEAAGLDEMLGGDAPSHWARAVLEERFALAPLDYLSDDTLAPYRYLLMAQPRGLSAEENVALDRWVQEGGRLVLFADPMMTGESRFHLGDRRRPQDVALLSPILAHWGLEMHFDTDQPGGPQVSEHLGGPIPVNLRGHLSEAGEARFCTIPGDGLLADCAIGQGRALVIADAAIVDIVGPHAHAEDALRRIADHVFVKIGDDAGIDAQQAREVPESPANWPEMATPDNHADHAKGGNPGQ